MVLLANNVGPEYWRVCWRRFCILKCTFCLLSVKPWSFNCRRDKCSDGLCKLSHGGLSRSLCVRARVCFLLPGQNERGCGTQWGEPQHPGHEQPGDLADLRPRRGHPSHRAAQHPLLQRAGGVDSHQRHTQPCEFPRRVAVLVSTLRLCARESQKVCRCKHCCCCYTWGYFISENSQPWVFSPKK